jgi:hypothetical protein
MGSYSQTFPCRCQNGHEGDVRVWLVVDGERQPDLLGSADLTSPRCPRCSATAEMHGQPSLLVYRPDKRPQFLFGSTAPDADLQREQAQTSMLMLAKDRHQVPQGAAIVVPYELVTVMAQRDVVADADQLDAGRFIAVSADLQRYREWLQTYAEERFQEASKPVLLSFLQAPDEGALREVLAAHPLLLDARVDALLQKIAEVADEDGQPQMAFIARARRHLLDQVREHGVDQVLPGPT